MIIEAKAHNKYLKPRKKGGVGLSEACLSLKLEADRPQEVPFLTELFQVLQPYGASGAIKVYRKGKRNPVVTYESGKK